MDKSNIQLEKHLAERIKELSCLYKISQASHQFANSAEDIPIEQQLKEIANIIPEGFQHEENLLVHISVPERGINIGKAFEDDRENLRFQSKVMTLECSYKNSKFSFLKEEYPLVEKIGQELNALLFRKEQKEKDLLLQKKLQREDRLNVLTELTAGIAHELNTPLGNILGYAELLKKAEVDKNKQKDLDKIVSSALQAREIVKKLMYFSCEIPTNFNLVDVQHLLNETLELLLIQLQEKQLTIEKEFNAKDCFVYGDAVQLTQVFLNLLINAIQASKVGSKINVNCKGKQDHIEVTFQDFGEGISATNKAKLFQPFFTTKKNGTGLGLAVAHGIITAHKAKIEVQSKPNNGTIFKLIFPTTKAKKI